MGGDIAARQLMKGTAVLALAAFLSKLLGVVYKIPYQNITGDRGFYVYEQVYPIYMILLTLATAGIPVAVSKMVAERLALSDAAGARKVFKASAMLLSLTGFLFFSALFFGAPVVAAILAEPRLTLPIQSVSFALLVVPVMAAIRGYFQGHQNMVPTAVSQVVEQIVRVVTIIWLSYWLVTHQYDVFHAGAGAVFGAFTGAVAALVVLLFYWRKAGQKGAASSSLENQKVVLSGENGPLPVALPTLTRGEQDPISYVAVPYRTIIKQVVSYAIPISLGALVLPLFQLMDSLTIPRMLVFSGWETVVAQEARGVYARGHPLVQFAAFFATALSLALVPSISEANAHRNLEQIARRTRAALKFTWLVGLGAAVGLAVLARPINMMIYITDEGTAAIAVLAFVIIFSTLSITSGAVLQGMGHVTLPARHLLVGVGVKTALNLALLPVLGISGAALASVIGYLTASWLNIRALGRMLPLRWFAKEIWLRPVLAVAVMGGAVWGVKEGLWAGLTSVIVHERLLSMAVALLSVMAGVVIYGAVLLKSGAVSRQELSLIPRSHRLLPYLEKLKLINREEM